MLQLGTCAQSTVCIGNVIYTYIYIYIYVYVYVICKYIYICVYMYMYIYIYLYVCVYIKGWMLRWEYVYDEYRVYR